MKICTYVCICACVYKNSFHFKSNYLEKHKSSLLKPNSLGAEHHHFVMGPISQVFNMCIASWWSFPTFCIEGSLHCLGWPCASTFPRCKLTALWQWMAWLKLKTEQQNNKYKILIMFLYILWRLEDISTRIAKVIGMRKEFLRTPCILARQYLELFCYKEFGHFSPCCC